MKKLITTTLMTILLFSVSANAQSYGRTSGCGTLVEDIECMWFLYETGFPLGDDVSISLAPGLQFPLGTDQFYIEGEIKANFNPCPMHMNLFVIEVDYIRACDTCATQLPGDVNYDGSITTSDISFLDAYLSGTGTKPPLLANADPNGDCIVDFNDVDFLDAYINSAGPAPVDCTCIEPDTCSFQNLGDFDNSGFVDISDLVDLLTFLAQGGAPPAILANADINGDCIINFDDFEAIELYVYGQYEIVDCTCLSPAYNTNRKPGDFNSDGIFSIADIDYFDEYLHDNGPKPLPLANGDTNGDCIVNIGDSKLLYDFLFHSGSSPVETTCINPEYLSVCCWETRGNADYDPKDEIDISDLIVIVDYMFRQGSEPICYEEADFNGSSMIDISDLINLISYMFQDGPNPAECQ